MGFALAWQEKLLFLESPKKMIEEIAQDVEGMLATSMVGVRRLRALAGRLSWIAGVVPRLRWVVNVVYAVVAAVDSDVGSGREEQRRATRPDARDKAATKRCRTALVWVRALLAHFPGGLTRSVLLLPGAPRWVIVTDASPSGAGAILCDARSGQVLEAMEEAWSSSDTATLGLIIGDSATQAPFAS